MQARDNLEQERMSLKMEIEKLQQRYNSAQEKTIEAQTQMTQLVERLDRSEQGRQINHQQLADTSATMQAYNSSKVSRDTKLKANTVLTVFSAISKK